MIRKVRSDFGACRSKQNVNCIYLGTKKCFDMKCNPEFIFIKSTPKISNIKIYIKRKVRKK